MNIDLKNDPAWKRGYGPRLRKFAGIILSTALSYLQDSPAKHEAVALLAPLNRQTPEPISPIVPKAATCRSYDGS